MYKQLFVYFTIATATLAGCGGEAGDVPELGKPNADANPGGSEGDGTGGTGGKTGDGKTGGTPPSPVVFDTAALSGACGYDLEAADVPFENTTLNALPRTMQGSVPAPIIGVPIAWEATLAGTTVVSGSPATSRIALAATLASVKPEAGRLAALPLVKAANVTADATLAGANITSFLQTRQDAFANVVCGVQAALTVTAKAGDGTEVAVAFAAPVPWQVNHLVPAAQLALEIGSGLQFAPVEATVTRSTHATVKAGTKFTFGAKIAPSAATQTVEVGGQSATIGGDVAYTITYEVSDQAAATALGLAGSRTLFLVEDSLPLKALFVTTSAGNALFVRP